jgi:hypothetical protein
MKIDKTTKAVSDDRVQLTVKAQLHFEHWFAALIYFMVATSGVIAWFPN